MGYTTLPLTPEQQHSLVKQVERGSAAAGFPYPFFLEVLDNQCCSPFALGSLHFTVFSAGLPQQQRRQLAAALIQAAAVIKGCKHGEPAVIFKPLPSRAMALGGTLLCDLVSNDEEKEAWACIPS